jgi:UDP-N-acetylglucosamine--dolichyl-phosphate N-acetylglucosaminephosphotransferase
MTFIPVYRMIPTVKQYTLKAGLSGKDINKKGTPAGEVPVPEALGIVPASIFIIFSMCAIYYSKIYASNLAF